jgi:hypothetical protein
MFDHSPYSEYFFFIKIIYFVVIYFIIKEI